MAPRKKIEKQLTNLAPEEVADMARAPTDAQMRRLQVLGQKMLDEAATIATLEGQLEMAQGRYKKITMEDLPAVMDEAGTDKLGMPGARADLILKPYYHASIKEENREDAHEWLERSGHGDLIKSTVTVSLPRSEYERMQRLEQALQIIYPDAEISIAKAVHWATLTAFVREQVEAGNVLPLDLLGAIVGRVVTIKMRDSNKEKSSGKTKRK